MQAYRTLAPSAHRTHTNLHFASCSPHSPPPPPSVPTPPPPSALPPAAPPLLSFRRKYLEGSNAGLPGGGGVGWGGWGGEGWGGGFPSPNRMQACRSLALSSHIKGLQCRPTAGLPIVPTFCAPLPPISLMRGLQCRPTARLPSVPTFCAPPSPIFLMRK